MASYTTNSGFTDLVGSMEVTNNDATSYTSTSLGVTVTPQNNGGSGLNFNVSFPTVNRTYHIQATPNGNNYSGHANNNGPATAQEDWTATASTGDTADAARAGSGYGSADDAAKKTPAS